MTPAAALLCLVVGVSDGDTVKVRCGEGEQQRVRLAQIDVPKKGQAHGQRARQELSDLIYGKAIEMLPVDTDRYGRTVAQLWLQGTDVNFEMMRLGFTWCYRKYLHDQSCLEQEAAAKKDKRGLWQESEPVPPWEWRHARGIGKP